MKIIITETQFRLLKESDEDENLIRLLFSNDNNNVELGKQLAKGLNINLKKLIKNNIPIIVDVLEPPYFYNLKKITKDLNLVKLIINTLFQKKYGDNENIYVGYYSYGMEVHNSEINHPGGTMVYFEDDDWEEFEYLPDGVVLVTSENGTHKEQY